MLSVPYSFCTHGRQGVKRPLPLPTETKKHFDMKGQVGWFGFLTCHAARAPRLIYSPSGSPPPVKRKCLRFRRHIPEGTVLVRPRSLRLKPAPCSGVSVLTPAPCVPTPLLHARTLSPWFHPLSASASTDHSPLPRLASPRSSRLLRAGAGHCLLLLFLLLRRPHARVSPSSRHSA